MWLADDDQVEAIERREAEVLQEEESKNAAGGKKKRKAAGGKKKDLSMDDMYHEGEQLTPTPRASEGVLTLVRELGEGKFEDASHEASGAATPLSGANDGQPAAKKARKGGAGAGGMSKKAKEQRKRLQVIDGEV